MSQSMIKWIGSLIKKEIKRTITRFWIKVYYEDDFFVIFVI